jgi:molecular chaperone GrpE (heat shock protein)
LHEETDRTAASERQQALAVESREPAVREPEPEPVEQDTPCADLEEWRDRALRLQADMENYRKRQQRTAQEQAVRERNRLLNEFLNVVDDLERALSTPANNGTLDHGDGLRGGGPALRSQVARGGSDGPAQRRRGRSGDRRPGHGAWIPH